MRPSFALFAVVGLIAVFIMCQIVEARRIGGLHGDETYYMHGGYMMVTTGDWLTPRYDSGDLRLRKPVLTYWLTGASFRLFGLGLVQGRLPALILTLCSLVFVYGLGMVLFRDRSAALLAAAAHLATYQVYTNAHQGRTDAVLSFFVIFAMYYFARLLFEPGRERRDAVLAYAAVAGAVLTKGFMAIGLIILPVAVFLAVCWKRTGKARWRAVLSPYGLGVMILLVVLWFAFALAQHGSSFTDQFLTDQLVRKVSGSKWYILSNIAEYPKLLAIGCLPWTVPVLLSFVTNDSGVRRIFKEFGDKWVFLAVWLGVPFVILLFGDMTRGRYLLPAIPAATVAVGLVLSRLGTSGPRPRGSVWGLYVLAAAALAAGIGCAVLLLAPACVGLASVPAELSAGLALILAAAATLCFARSRLLQEAALCLAFSSMIFMLLSYPFSNPKGVTDATASLAGRALVRQPKDAPLASVGLYRAARMSVLFYSGRTLTEWNSADNTANTLPFLRDYSRKPGYKLLLIDGKTYRGLPEDTLKGWTVIAREPDAAPASTAHPHHRTPSFLRSLSPPQDEESTVYLLSSDAPAGAMNHDKK